jgi:polyisoprenoid-binding protein YceI
MKFIMNNFCLQQIFLYLHQQIIMKTIKLVFSAALAMAIMVGCNNNAKVENTEIESGINGDFSVDTETSAIMWKGGMFGVKSHNGSIDLNSGSISLENSSITGGEFVVDMTTIMPLDSNYGEEEHTKEDLVGHLSTNDFFLVDSFPTAKFVITGADSTGVTGDLTIRDQTNSEKVTNVVINKTENGVELSGDLTFDRSKYGVQFESSSKDFILSNDIILTFKVVAQP